MTDLYRQVRDGEEVSNQDLMTSVFGMMLHMSSNMSRVDSIRADVTDRISALEAKVGSADEVATQLGLAIQNLPVPTNGNTELQNVRNALSEIRAPNVDVNVVITKAVRKSSKDETREGAGDSRLGTVLVEISSVEAKSLIMKNKKVLEQHTYQSSVKKLTY